MLIESPFLGAGGSLYILSSINFAFQLWYFYVKCCVFMMLFKCGHLILAERLEVTGFGDVIASRFSGCSCWKGGHLVVAKTLEVTSFGDIVTARLSNLSCWKLLSYHNEEMNMQCGRREEKGFLRGVFRPESKGMRQICFYILLLLTVKVHAWNV
ncbi:hypothetical protein Cgig2_000324 [Carnegiea gigantea]|uniref:Uncharacterized protein n=1 Tax=Carnegiea gigantea TaxID=171969 RepID=A0A9Q1JGZ7_9CARY|nr:hypothetical protein Cgig2_000324 [Carnegiea gigantea]